MIFDLVKQANIKHKDMHAHTVVQKHSRTDGQTGILIAAPANARGCSVQSRNSLRSNKKKTLFQSSLNKENNCALDEGL